MRVVITLMWIACPLCSVLIVAPMLFGPMPDWLRIGFALAQPAAAWAFYRLIRRATLQQVIDQVNDDDD